MATDEEVRLARLRVVLSFLAKLAWDLVQVWLRGGRR